MVLLKAKKIRVPKLPSLLDRKFYKTGQTRGADDDVIYQNRVSRSSTVLIPYSSWINPFPMPNSETEFENGYIVLISPNDYFDIDEPDEKLKAEGLELGHNALIFYETREQWDKYNPEKFQWQPANNRTAPLGGKYVARVPATTAIKGGEKINRGFTTTSNKGAGIRVFEYASPNTINQCRLQLEALFWMCCDAESIAAKSGMEAEDIGNRKTYNIDLCLKEGLLDFDKLIHTRLINKQKHTVCPLCLEQLSAAGFFNRMEQAEGREVPDLTVTELNLFHIEELRTGLYNHRPYNIGWGHHHCNVVIKDSGIINTLRWMMRVIHINTECGHLDSPKSVG